ncbi:MAG: 30S ribosomal protein S8 [Candidatus Omnitrophica bacterium]|nr:30S ribosomal protein S8 [Candidatus Omnitrophota bacterium]
MAVTDAIADMLTVIRNGSRAKKEKVDVKNSKIGQKILTIFKDEGYIKNYKVIDDNKQGMIRVYLKYRESDKQPSITQITRISTPGLRKYSKRTELPRPLRGLGTAIISTPKGVITDKEARREKVGGEVICYIW